MTGLKRLIWKVFKGDKMNKNIAKYTLRVDKELLKKFKYICEYNCRSVNKQIEKYITNSVESFERKY